MGLCIAGTIVDFLKILKIKVYVFDLRKKMIKFKMSNIECSKSLVFNFLLG